MGRPKRAVQQLDEAFETDPALSNGAASSSELDTDDASSQNEQIDLGANDSGQEDDPLTVLQRSYDQLKTEAEKHRQEADEARKQAAQASRTADNYRIRAEQTGLEARQASIAAVESATAHTKNNITALKAEIARAGAAQEWDVFADAQEALAQNISYLQQLSDNRIAVENQHADRTPSSAVEGDRIEQFISTLSPRSQKWLREHKADVFSSSSRQNKAQAAHNMAVADGLELDSDAYFTEMDKYMGYGSTSNDNQTRTVHQRQPGAVTSAPPARTNPSQPSTNNQLRLTKEQQETAVQIFSDKKREDALALYAKHLRDIQGGKTNLMTSTNKYRGGYNGI